MKKQTLLLLIFIIPVLVQAQNVGIGTSTPTEKLHVAGNVKMDTIKPNSIKFIAGAGAAKVLTSDAQGNASWQAAAISSSPGNIGFGVWGDCATNGNISEYNPVADTVGGINTYFASSVAISGNYAVVGAELDNTSIASSGSASVYQFNGTNWVFMQKLTDATGATADHFGNSVAISGNYIVVGAFMDDVGVNADKGSVSFFELNGGTWVLTQKVTDATGAANDHFGKSVSISGGYAVVGSDWDDIGANMDQGSASIYQYGGIFGWVLSQKIWDSFGSAGDNFGTSVSISGSYVVIGVPNADVGGTNTDRGWASIYHFNGSAWVATQNINGLGGLAGDLFGTSVCISGSYLVVGAPGYDLGSYVNCGAAFTYHFDGSNWVSMQTITDPADLAGDQLGSNVSLSGNYLIAGVFNHDVGSNLNQGMAKIYCRFGSGWLRIQDIIDPVGTSFDRLGQITAIDGSTKRFLIAEPGYINNTGKAIFGKLN